MRVQEEFSRYALTYDQYNLIQAKVAAKLASMLPDFLGNVLDIGCGSGSMCRLLEGRYSHFIGIDFSTSMLDLHPKSPSIELIEGDFNTENFLSDFSNQSLDWIISASALQWSRDLRSVFGKISEVNTSLALALFTSGTFKTLYQCASIDPILLSADEMIEAAQNSFEFDMEFEVVRYALEFDSVREMFRYIKRSGVSGGRRVLDYPQTRTLMRSYPLKHLEFEVLFMIRR